MGIFLPNKFVSDHCALHYPHLHFQKINANPKKWDLFMVEVNMGQMHWQGQSEGES